MTARPLSRGEYEEEGLGSLLQVFADPGEGVLAEGVETAAIVYPVDSSDALIVARQLDAIRAAAADAGDQAVYLTMLETTTAHRSFNEGLYVDDLHLLSLTENWLFPLPDIQAYLEVKGTQVPLEHALHSPDGRWAMLFSYEGYAALAGQASIVEGLLDTFPLHADGVDARDSVRLWLRDMRALWDSYDHSSWSPNPWVPRLTLNLYGANRGRTLLAANGWADFAHPPSQEPPLK